MMTSSPGPEADGGHRRNQRVAAARREREMLDAEKFRVARFEPVALSADAVSEKRLGADYLRERVDLFLPDQVHDGLR